MVALQSISSMVYPLDPSKRIYLNFRIIGVLRYHFMSFITFFICKNLQPYFFSYVVLAGLLTWLGLKHNTEEEDPLIETLKRAVLCITKEDFDTAERILHISLKIAQERMDPQGITYVYDMLANVAFSKKEWAKAEVLFVETMKRMISSGTTKTDNSIVEMSLKLAQIFANLSQHQKAVDGFEFCLKTQQDKFAKPSESVDEETNSKALLGIIHSTYAAYLLNREKYTETLKQYKEGLHVALEIYGEENYQALILMNDVGTVFSLIKEYDKAVQYIDRAIAVGTKISSPDIPAFYCNKATIEMRRGNLDAAYTMCQNAIETAKQINDKNTLEEAKTTLKDIQQLMKNR